jgi:hypothetical protein
MLLVIGKMAYVRDFIPGMTVMTLMTVLYGLILKIVPSKLDSGAGQNISG